MDQREVASERMFLHLKQQDEIIRNQVQLCIKSPSKRLRSNSPEEVKSDIKQHGRYLSEEEAKKIFDQDLYNKVLQDTKVEQERRVVQKRLQMFGNIQSGPPSSNPEPDLQK